MIIIYCYTIIRGASMDDGQSSTTSRNHPYMLSPSYCKWAIRNEDIQCKLACAHLIVIVFSFWLVDAGWWFQCEKYARQIGSFPQVGVKIKTIWNHHPLIGTIIFRFCSLNQFSKSCSPRAQCDECDSCRHAGHTRSNKASMTLAISQHNLSSHKSDRFRSLSCFSDFSVWELILIYCDDVPFMVPIILKHKTKHLLQKQLERSIETTWK